MNPLRVALIGPPASGKGTQAARLHARTGMNVLSPGSFFREEKRKGSVLGMEVDRITRDGGLVPDDLVTEVVRQWLQTYGENGFILDGYPRSIGQAVSLERMLEEANRPLVAVIGLNCFEGTMRDRISRRVQCVACPYSGTPSSSHAVEEVNQNGARCPDCGEELLRRADDSQEAFSTRLNLYENLTAPLFEHYAAKQLLLEVDGEQSIDAVEAKILGALNWQCSVSCEDKAA